MPTEETTIDCTPTWESMVPVIIQGLQSDRHEAQTASTSELTRVCQLADRANERNKHLSCVFRALLQMLPEAQADTKKNREAMTEAPDLAALLKDCRQSFGHGDMQDAQASMINLICEKTGIDVKDTLSDDPHKNASWEGTK